MKKFKIDKSRWKSINIESAKFIYSESKEYLNYTIEESAKITNRAYSLVLLLSSILSAIVAFTFSKLLDGQINLLVYLTLFLSVIITGLLIALVWLVFPRKIMANGRIPKELTKPEFITPPRLKEDETLLAFYIQEIENLQDKIDFNLTLNKKRGTILKTVMYSISILLFICPMLAILIIT